MMTTTLTRGALKLLVFALAAASGLAAQAAQQTEQRLCINEGATTAVGTFALEARYRKLADVIQKATSRKVNVMAFTKVPLFLAEYEGGRCDYAFGKSVDALAEGIRVDRERPGSGYHALAKVAEPYVAGLIVHKDFAGTSLRSLVGLDVMLPPKDTFTAQLALSELRQAGLRVVVRDTLDKYPTDVKDAVTVRHIPYHEAVSQFVDNGLYKAGAVNPTVLAAWQGKVLMKFQPQPGWLVLAHSSTSERDRGSVSAALIDLHKTAEGMALLKSLKASAFVPATDAEYLAVLERVRGTANAALESGKTLTTAKTLTSN